MESHEAKNTMKLLASVFISLAGRLLQGASTRGEGRSGYSPSHGGKSRLENMPAGDGQSVTDLQIAVCVRVSDSLFGFHLTSKTLLVQSVQNFSCGELLKNSSPSCRFLNVSQQQMYKQAETASLSQRCSI